MAHLCGLAALIALLCAPQEPKKYRLVFEPKSGESMEIRYVHDTSWEYAEEDMKGTMTTELDLRWKFEAPSAGRITSGLATYTRVVYRGKGVKKGKDFNYDIMWTSKDGYVKGKDSEGDKSWASGEIKEGLKLEVDNRAACNQGDC